MKKLLLIVLISSCISQKKLVKICAENYPCDTTIVRVDTSFFSDTQYIKTETIDTFIITQNKTIVETKYVESTAKLELAKQSHKKALKELNDRDLAQILDLNRMLDKKDKEIASLTKDKEKANKEVTILKDKLKSANKFKWYFIGLLLFLLGNIVLKWFMPRLF